MSEEKVMKYVKDFMLVEIKENQNLVHEMEGANGEKVTLYLDNEYNRMSEDYIPEDDSYIPHEGKVLSMPRGLNPKFRESGLNLDELESGDTIYVNHLAVNAHNRLTEGKYFLSLGRDIVGAITSNVLAKKVGEELVPVYDWSIFEAVENKYEHSTLIIPDHMKEKKREDILKLISPSKQLGDAEQGDMFVVNENAIYPLKIDGVKYFFVRTENVLLKILD